MQGFHSKIFKIAMLILFFLTTEKSNVVYSNLLSQVIKHFKVTIHFFCLEEYIQTTGVIHSNF